MLTSPGTPQTCIMSFAPAPSTCYWVSVSIKLMQCVLVIVWVLGWHGQEPPAHAVVRSRQPLVVFWQSATDWCSRNTHHSRKYILDILIHSPGTTHSCSPLPVYTDQYTPRDDTQLFPMASIYIPVHSPETTHSCSPNILSEYECVKLQWVLTEDRLSPFS
jgi:hypothetical protein